MEWNIIMSRKRGTPAYKNKTIGPKTFTTTRIAWQKIRAAEKRTGKSRSDVLTHCVMVAANDITKEVLEKSHVEATADALHTAAEQPIEPIEVAS